MRHALGVDGFRLTYCHNVTLGRRDFYRQLCLALGLPRGHYTAGDVYTISTHVEELAKERVLPVLLVDEAHLLHQDTLDHLHILLNYAWDSRALLSLVLIGLPELDDRMRLRRNRSLFSRMHHRLSIGPLVPDDTADYGPRTRQPREWIEGALLPGCRRAAPHEACAGSLRDVDRLATASLRLAARRKRKVVERDVVARVVQADAGARA